jgi:hypothetical protein
MVIEGSESRFRVLVFMARAHGILTPTVGGEIRESGWRDGYATLGEWEPLERRAGG